MFSESDRARVRTALLARAGEDDRLTAAAITGSHASGTEDRWSDVDLFFGVRDDVPIETVQAGWSASMYREFGAVHHFDLVAQGARYRAFLLGTGLQVDLGFAAGAGFAPMGQGAFDVVFGSAGPRRQTPPDVPFLLGMAWHHVLHVRAAVERGRLWRAEHWLAALRDVTLGLASIRHGLPWSYARGADDLPASVTGPLRRALPTSLTVEELDRALRVAATAVLTEVRQADAALAARLGPLLTAAASGASELRT